MLDLVQDIQKRGTFGSSPVFPAQGRRRWPGPWHLEWSMPFILKVIDSSATHQTGHIQEPSHLRFVLNL